MVRLNSKFSLMITTMIPPLPYAAVVIHFTDSCFSKNIEQKVITAIEACVEYESSSEDGRHEFVLEFSDWDIAVKMVHSMADLTNNSNLLMLVAKSYTDESITPIIYKDEYRPHRVNQPTP